MGKIPDVLEAALEYARNGLPVFPCDPKTKKPLTANGFKAASTDEGEIRKHWGKFPNAMIGVPTGTKSGMWVTDVDVDPSKNSDGMTTLRNLIAQHGELPKTLMTITPRGGRHFIFSWANGIEIRNSAGKIGLGIDVRGNGGYVCLPPSQRADGVQYRWDPDSGATSVPAPDWLIDLAGKRHKNTWAQAALDKECQAVANAKSGTRNHALNTAAFNLFQLVAGGQLNEQDVRRRLFEAAEACGLVADDGAQAAWDTINSGARGGGTRPRTGPRQQFTATVAATSRPQIKVIPGELPRVVNEAEDALLLPGCEIYQRGGKLMRPVLNLIKASGDREFQSWQLIEVTRPHLVTALCCAAQFQQYDKRSKKFVPIDAPARVAEALLHSWGSWKLPRIAGTANAPFLRADGTIHDQEGFDPVSGLFCRWNGKIFPAVPSSPDKAEATAALAELKKPLNEFPFVTAADKAAALSAILTALDRRGMDVAPLHAFTAPAAGTGKGLLVDVIATLATGRPASVINQSRHDDEFTKCLGAALLAGASLIAIDNCEHILENSLLNIAVRQQVFEVRVLGVSQNIEIPNNTTIFANGNNLTIGADLTRRTIRCEMDAQMERPELRRFNDNRLLDTVKTNRGKLVVAALTVLRAWHLARPNAGLKLQPLDFEDWSRRVREALVWLGEDDPGSTMETVRADDPYRMDRAAVFFEWRKALYETPTLVRDVIASAFTHPDFYAALLTVAASRNGKEISPDRLGRWLARNKGSVVNDLILERTGILRGGFPLWRIRRIV